MTALRVFGAVVVGIGTVYLAVFAIAAVLGRLAKDHPATMDGLAEQTEDEEARRLAVAVEDTTGGEES